MFIACYKFSSAWWLHNNHIWPKLKFDQQFLFVCILWWRVFVWSFRHGWYLIAWSSNPRLLRSKTDHCFTDDADFSMTWQHIRMTVPSNYQRFRYRQDLTNVIWVKTLLLLIFSTFVRYNLKTLFEVDLEVGSRTKPH